MEQNVVKIFLNIPYLIGIFFIMIVENDLKKYFWVGWKLILIHTMTELYIAQKETNSYVKFCVSETHNKVKSVAVSSFVSL